MVDLLDFMERAITAPIVPENDFYIKTLIPNIRKIVREFDLQYSPDNPILQDDAFADRLFEAAIELLVCTGIYCDDTNRVIQLGRDEIISSVKNFPEGSTFGEGQDRNVFKSRKPEDENPPWCHVGTGIVASSEDIAFAQVEGYGSIQQANSISIPAFNKVRDMQVIGGSPLEIYATTRAVQTGRKALTSCGRPGLPILNLISSATTSMGTIAGSHPNFGLRASDGWLIDFLAEVKVNFESLNRLAFAHITGCNIGSTALPVFGGYAGGAEGTALIMVAYHLAGMLLLQGNYHLTGPIHFRYGCSTTREILWAFSAAGRATSRNTRYPAIGLAYAASGPASQTYFYEAAATMLSLVVSGYAGVQTVHPGKAIIEDGVTPLEACFCVETAHAATGMQADRANELVNKLLDNYEKEIEQAPAGKRYQECFDIETGEPSDDYQKLYDETKSELANLGIPF
jgi:methylamine--corrinoid protein Co-methyltransferase